MKSPLIVAGLSLLVAACVSPPAEHAVSLPVQPTPAEVSDHVAARWEGRYSGWFSPSAGHPPGKPALVSVSKLSCRPYYFVWDCEYEVTARFEGGAERARIVSSQFERDAGGAIQETMLFVHSTRR